MRGGGGPGADPVRAARIGIATSLGRPYYRFSALLRGMGAGFDPLLPREAERYRGDLVLSTRAESPRCRAPVLHEEVLGCHPTVARGMMVRELGPWLEPDDLVLGVDPGRRTGLHVSYCGHEIECSFHTSARGLVSHMAGVMGGLRAGRKVVKMGNGSSRAAGEIASLLNLGFCSSFELETVDERGTSPRTRNRNQGGKRDMLSARRISRMEGSRRRVLPLSITG